MTTQRSCDGCTKCCEGYLGSVIREHPMFPGKPCHFKIKGGCEIYEERPQNPCRNYSCEWLVNPEIPGWLKPDEVNAIITKRKTRTGVEYWEVVEAGEKLRVEVLNWLFLHHLIYETNIRYQLSGSMIEIGNEEFRQSI